METKRIGVAVVLAGDQVVVGVRETGQVLAGMHEFPGGKCEAEESPEACAVRECFEETGLSVAPEKLLYQTTHEYPHGRVELHFFQCRPEDETTPLLGNFQWRSRASLKDCTFPEANTAVVNLLLESDS